MAKRNKPIPKQVDRKKIAMCTYIKDKIDKTMPFFYAAISVALWRCLDAPDEEKGDMIATLIAESQIIWNQCADEEKNIIDWCEELTGIDIRNSVS